MSRLGIFGGTFDPVHLGHLAPALVAQRAFDLNQVVFVPAGNPPHKLAEPRTPFSHRFAMLALATQDHDRFTVSDIEAERAGPSYTVDTLRQLRAGDPAAALFFLMGSDSFAQISTWHRWDELLDLASLVVLRRSPAWGGEMLSAVPPRLTERVRAVAAEASALGAGAAEHLVYLLDCPPHPASATAVRTRLRAGEPVGDLVPPAVERYIVKHALYHGRQRDADGR